MGASQQTEESRRRYGARVHNVQAVEGAGTQRPHSFGREQQRLESARLDVESSLLLLVNLSWVMAL